MFFSSPDLLSLVAAFSVFLVSVFLCWVLYELARLLRQTNAMVEDTRQKIHRVESFIAEISERMDSASQYLGIIASAGKELFGWMRDRRRLVDEDESSHEEDAPKRRRK